MSRASSRTIPPPSPTKRRAMAILELLDTDLDVRRLVKAHGDKPTGPCSLCGNVAPLAEIPDPRAAVGGVFACAWECDFPCQGYPCDGCPACCPGLRNGDFWRRASAYPLSWWLRLDDPTTEAP